MSLEDFREVIQRPETFNWIGRHISGSRCTSALVFYDRRSVYIGEPIHYHTESLVEPGFFDGIENDLYAKAIKLVRPYCDHAEERIDEILDGHPSENQSGVHILLHLREYDPIDVELEKKLSSALSKKCTSLSKNGSVNVSTTLPVGLSYYEYCELEVLRSRCRGEVGSFVIEPRCHGSVIPIFSVKQKVHLKTYENRLLVLPRIVALEMCEATEICPKDVIEEEKKFREKFYELERGTIDLENRAVVYDSDFLETRG